MMCLTVQGVLDLSRSMCAQPSAYPGPIGEVKEASGICISLEVKFLHWTWLWEVDITSWQGAKGCTITWSFHWLRWDVPLRPIHGRFCVELGMALRCQEKRSPTAKGWSWGIKERFCYILYSQFKIQRKGFLFFWFFFCCFSKYP